MRRRRRRVRGGRPAPILRSLSVRRASKASTISRLRTASAAARKSDFVAFLGDLVARTPEGPDLHCIVDNLKTHDTDLVHEFLTVNPHVHFTPHPRQLAPTLEDREEQLRRGEVASVEGRRRGPLDLTSIIHETT